MIGVLEIHRLVKQSRNGSESDGEPLLYLVVSSGKVTALAETACKTVELARAIQLFSSERIASFGRARYALAPTLGAPRLERKRSIRP
jgi:hypothetical protein